MADSEGLIINASVPPERKSRTWIWILFVYQLIDLGLSSLLFSHLNHWMYYFALGFKSYWASLLDLWIISACRACLLFGLLIGSTIGQSQEVAIRLKRIQPIVALSCTGIWTYSMVRLLLWSEHRMFSDWSVIIWDWCLIGWSCVAPGFLYGAYCKLSSVIQSQAPPSETEEEQSDEEKPKKGTIRRLIALSRPDWPYIIVALLFLLLNCGFEIFIPLYIGDVIQAVAIETNHKLFVASMLKLAGFSIASAFAQGMRSGFFRTANARLNIRIRASFFESIVHQEVGFYDEKSTGDISSRLQSDTQVMSDALGLNANVFLRSFLKGVGDVVFMVHLCWRLSFVTFIGMPLLIAFSKMYGSYYEKLSEKVQDSLSEANQISEEACSSIRTVHSLAGEELEDQRYKEKLGRVYNLNMKEARALSVYSWGNSLFSMGLLLMTLFYGGHLVTSGMMKGGSLVSFILYNTELANNLQSIGYVYTGLMQASGASAKVFAYIDRPPHINTKGSHSPPKVQGKLEFKDVWFNYPSKPDQMVLKGISFVVQPGEVVALVGPSGGGKSSCVSLLQHLYEPTDGYVLLDDVPVQNYQHKYLHHKMAAVGQEPVLFARSVKENIAYGLDEYTMADVEHAAKLAYAYDFVNDMKEKFDTKVGEKGSQLSGGQKQRVAIARALIRKPSVLLLDEATSALDTQSEYMVQQALEQNFKDRTVLIIAHRLSTVEHANRVIVIKEGCIVGQGSHESLLAECQLYYNLVHRQLIRTDSPARETSQRRQPHPTPSRDRLTDNPWLVRTSLSAHPSHTTLPASV